MAYDLLTDLHNSGKYEVAEFSSYISDDDSRIHELPWKVYPVAPSERNTEEIKNYREK
jgi:hypothetical protein